ncbi:uncharacterized protein [Rutidosis leptorrhynchoides]|uniref:uncharacterized protein n=1 Tax=Rutidosis leptorrhynchoides TaxID=125765 RepID=UPI003A99B0FC
MSQYLFTLVMEVLTLMFKRNIESSTMFKYHPKCEKHRIINLCFADDLFLFSHGNVASVVLIRDAIQEFKRCSGLTPSIPKCTVFFSNIPQPIQQLIHLAFPFEVGSLPIRYLGVPLVSTCLIYWDCKVLVDRIRIKIDD